VKSKFLTIFSILLMSNLKFVDLDKDEMKYSMKFGRDFDSHTSLTIAC